MNKRSGINLEKAVEQFKELYPRQFETWESYELNEVSKCIDIKLKDGHTAVWYPQNDLNVQQLNKPKKKKKNDSNR